jgi:hypothetical protein
MAKETLKTLRAKIRKEVPYVDVKPYSHNIISLVLRQISLSYGDDEANKAIRDFGLKSLGWSESK